MEQKEGETGVNGKRMKGESQSVLQHKENYAHERVMKLKADFGRERGRQRKGGVIKRG